MGVYFTDQYSLLHAAVGMVSRYWNIPLFWLLVLHTVFEALENTAGGMWFINTYIPWWPGGKPHPDSILNRVGDTVYALLGWIVAHAQFAVFNT
jgi:hypothetical protein